VSSSPRLTVGVFSHHERSFWVEPLTAALPDHVVVDGSEPHDHDRIDVAVVGNVPTEGLTSYRRLALIQSLWMGVDRFLDHPGVPDHVPIARMVDPGMPRAMAETVVAHVLGLHRLLPFYRAQAATRTWAEHAQPFASDRTVAIMGLGTLGTAAVAALIPFGFRLVGWNRSGAAVTGVEVGDFAWVLGQADIVVNLLPLTPQTTDCFDAAAFALMRPGASFVNLGRGHHVVDDDLLAALDSGHLTHAVLDVFRTEPLPAEHRFWTHPRVTVTPHVAADSDPRSCTEVIAQNVRRVAAGETPAHLIDRQRGY
jgi:glyoxylate/hydroxypyruvate reductase